MDREQFNFSKVRGLNREIRFGSDSDDNLNIIFQTQKHKNMTIPPSHIKLI